MQLRCKRCAADISSQNINIQEAVALCSQCGAVFPFSRFDLTTTGQNTRKVRQPATAESSREGETLLLTLPYYERFGLTGTRLLLVLVLLLTLGIEIGILFLGFAPALLCSIPVLLGMVGLASLESHRKCKIEFSPEFLSSNPESFESSSFSRDDILDIFCEESAESRERFGESKYNIFVLTADRKENLLAAKLPEAQARYATQELRRHHQRHEEIEQLTTDVENALIFHDEAFTLYPEERLQVDIFAESVDDLLKGLVDEPEPVLTPEYYEMLAKLSDVDEDFSTDFWDWDKF